MAAVRGTALTRERAAGVCDSGYAVCLAGQRGLSGRQSPVLVASASTQGQAKGDALSQGRSLAGRQNLDRRDAPWHCARAGTVRTGALADLAAVPDGSAHLGSRE